MMKNDVRNQIIKYANYFEKRVFFMDDPAQFLYMYPKECVGDIECLAFISAMLAFGIRNQFIKKIKYILELANISKKSITKWILSGYENFPGGEKKFYRFYSYDDMNKLFFELKNILEYKVKDNGDSLNKNISGLGEYLKIKYEQNKKEDLADIISKVFKNSRIVPKGKNSANKRIYLFLRWMVRQNSEVDLGLWNWYPQEKLLLPLDVHVIKEAIKLGLLKQNTKPTRKTAKKLTDMMKEIFPNDPCKSDFALFGIGISQEKINLS